MSRVPFRNRFYLPLPRKSSERSTMQSLASEGGAGVCRCRHPRPSSTPFKCIHRIRTR